MQAVPGTYGALLLGALIASAFSGIVAVQVIVYFKLFGQDQIFMKAIVLVVWILDLVHTTLLWIAMWTYLIRNFANPLFADHITETVALSVVLTAILTFISHCFFAHRIYRLSYNNWLLTFPVLVLALARLASASASGGEMIRSRSFFDFRYHYRWLFSMGLALSSATDVLITILLFFLLMKNRSRSLSMHHIIDSLILYTFEIGSLTSVTTVASLICWLMLDNSLIFLGLHFIIGKLYANSLLATFNTREQLRQARPSSVEMMNICSLKNLPPIHIGKNTHIDYSESSNLAKDSHLSTKKHKRTSEPSNLFLEL